MNNMARYVSTKTFDNYSVAIRQWESTAFTLSIITWLWNLL